MYLTKNTKIKRIVAFESNSQISPNQEINSIHYFIPDWLIKKETKSKHILTVEFERLMLSFSLVHFVIYNEF